MCNMTQKIVQIKQGWLEGKSAVDYKGGCYFSFQGIPYAKPPLNELRFKAPLPAEPWEGIRDATKEGNRCFSRHCVTGIIGGSEDCLFLNVYTPQIMKDEHDTLKPVMFWIHGGTFIMDSGGTELYGPHYLITEDIIVVTVNYRLGLLGFLSMEDPALGVPGNAAIKDFVMALTWVQENIKSFCGNPDNVTISGNSAGAALAHYLMLSLMAKGLFHRVIMQSGSALQTWAYGLRQSKAIAKTLGLENSNECDILKFLQSMSLQSLLDTQEKINKVLLVSKCQHIGPVLEKHSNELEFLTEHPIDIINSGNYSKVPILIGYTSKEGLLCDVIYKDFLDTTNFNNFQNMIPFYYNIPRNTSYSRNIASKIEKFYYENCKPHKNKQDIFYTMQTDALVLNGLYTTINTHMKNLNCPMYFYRISADTSLNLTKNLHNIKTAGACHGDELGYIFKNNYTPSFEKNSVEAKCIETIIRLWANFVKTGNPNSKSYDPIIPVTWEPVKPRRYNYLDFNTELSTGINLDIARMAIWDEISATNPNISKF